MKEIKEIIKKHDIVVVIMLIALVSSGEVFFKGVASGDEYLLLNHTLKMYNRKTDLQGY